jgi:hypothetical protein
MERARHPMERRDPTRPENVRRTAWAGAVGGIVAASAMLLFATIVSAMEGTGVLGPVMVIGATFLGESAMAQPIASSMLGLVTHVLMGAAFGMPFALVTRRIASSPLLLGAGVAYGAGIFLVMTYLVLPLVNPIMAATIEPGWWFLYHLAFGLLLPATLLVARRHVTREWFSDGRESVV